MKENTTTLAPVARAIPAQMPVTTFEEMTRVGQLFEQSGMFGCTQQGQGTVLAMTCLMTGMNPLEFQQTYHIVQGRPTMRADAMLARLLEFGGTYEIIARDADRAAIKATFRDASGTFTLNWQEAQLEPFTKGRDGKPKDNWASPRGRMQMLWARVVSDAVRTVCPLAVRGSYTPEEVIDFDPPARAHQPAPVAKPVDQEPVPTTEEPSRPLTTPPAKEIVTPEVLPAPGPVDFNVMPAGKFKGKPWTEFTDGQLAKALELDKPEFTTSHKDAVRAEIARRAQGGAS